MQRRDDSSLHSHSHSSMNNNIWYGADDAPGVIDVDISSSVAMLDYSYYNDNSAEYTSDGSGGKIEYVYVHDDDDIRDGISSNYRLDDDEEEALINLEARVLVKFSAKFIRAYNSDSPMSTKLRLFAPILMRHFANVRTNVDCN